MSKLKKIKKQKFWFSVGDHVVCLPLYGINPPEIGEVVEEGEVAVVLFKEVISYRGEPKKIEFNLLLQHQTWNNSNGNNFLLIRKGDMKRNKKDPKKFKVGDLVEITSDAPFGAGTGRKEKKPKIGETGIIIGMTPCEYFANIFLQADMRYVWREIHEIKKL